MLQKKTSYVNSSQTVLIPAENYFIKRLYEAKWEIQSTLSCMTGEVIHASSSWLRKWNHAFILRSRIKLSTFSAFLAPSEWKRKLWMPPCFPGVMCNLTHVIQLFSAAACHLDLLLKSELMKVNWLGWLRASLQFSLHYHYTSNFSDQGDSLVLL